MSLRRSLRRAMGLMIFGIFTQFAGALPQGELRAQTAPKTADGSGASAQKTQGPSLSASMYCIRQGAQSRSVIPLFPSMQNEAARHVRTASVSL